MYRKQEEKAHSHIETREYCLILNVEYLKKYSLKNKIHYINNNFDKFLPKIIEQLSSQV